MLYKRHFLLLFLIVLPFSIQAANNKINQFEYKALTQASELMEKGSWTKAKQHLHKSLEKMKGDYAKALAYYNIGQAELQLENFTLAIKNLKAARALNTLEPEQSLSMLKTIGQLYCSIDQWKKCTNTLEEWAKQKNKISAEDHLLFAQAYSQQDRWKKVIPHITKAIKSKRIAPENWYQLLIVSNIQLKRWKSAISAQQELIQHYANKAQHWRQLVSLHLQNRQSKSALAVQRISIEKGLFKTGKDYKLMAQLYLQQDMPFFAGKALQTALKRQLLKPTTRNIKMLTGAWILAKEDKKP